MSGNHHEPFLGEGGMATSPPLPDSEPKRTLGDASYLYQLNLSDRRGLKPLICRSIFLYQLGQGQTGTER